MRRQNRNRSKQSKGEKSRQDEERISVSYTLIVSSNLLSGSSLLCFAKSGFYCVLSHVAFINHLFVWATLKKKGKRRSFQPNFTILKALMV